MPLRLDVPGDGTPPTRLHQRRSLKLARSRSSLPELSTRRTKSVVVSPSIPKVPMEILEHIIDFYTDATLVDRLDSQKVAFRNFIAACTLVSKDVRFIVLRGFFANLSFENTKHSKALFRYLACVDLDYRTLGWPAGYSWVRSLTSPSFLIRFNTETLGHLTHLKNLAVDFAHSGLLLQKICLTEMFGDITLPCIVNSLTTMTLTNIPRIDIHLLTLISHNFTGVTRLHVSSTESLDDCCSGCYASSLTRIVHSPVPDLYTDVEHLINAYGTSLAPLKHLTHLFLGFFLSGSNLLDLHIDHSKDHTQIAQTFVETISTCSQCDNYRRTTKKHELVASLALARYLDSLEFVGWSSCFRRSCEAEGPRAEENVVEGYHLPNRADVLSNDPISAQSTGLPIFKRLSIPRSNTTLTTTTLAIIRTDEKIRVTRIL